MQISWDYSSCLIKIHLAGFSARDSVSTTVGGGGGGVGRAVSYKLKEYAEIPGGKAICRLYKKTAWSVRPMTRDKEVTPAVQRDL